MNNYYIVILAGGKGKRLWPASREACPKQFLDLLGTGETLLQATYRRYSQFIDKDNILIATSTEYQDLVRTQLPDVDPANILLESMHRNTVPAVLYASLEIYRRNSLATVLVTPSDQLITNEAVFKEDILNGMKYVDSTSRTLTVGVPAIRPEIQYGYIQKSAIEQTSDIYAVQSFCEKPDADFAKVLVESGEFLWNTGIFIYDDQTFLRTIHASSPILDDLVRQIVAGWSNGVNVHSLVERIFSMCPNMQLEQGILEKADNVDVMQAHFGWADVGSWKSMHDIMPKNAERNVVVKSDKVALHECHDCVVHLAEGTAAVIEGLEGYLVAQQDGILVICKKDNPDAIRRFVTQVKNNFGEQFV